MSLCKAESALVIDLDFLLRDRENLVGGRFLAKAGDAHLSFIANAKAITLRIPQLKDCKNHFEKKKEKGKGTMVFICEGQFPTRRDSITSCRDVNNQAVFVLKGKPLNVWDLMRACGTLNVWDLKLVVPVEE